MLVTTNNLIFISDPHHGWLKVPLVHLRLLGIYNQISPYSYYDQTYAYLEEDSDATIYLNARKTSDMLDPTITDHVIDKFDTNKGRF